MHNIIIYTLHYFVLLHVMLGLDIPKNVTDNNDILYDPQRHRIYILTGYPQRRSATVDL